SGVIFFSLPFFIPTRFFNYKHVPTLLASVHLTFSTILALGFSFCSPPWKLSSLHKLIYHFL
ncbi:hypothetical protein, partial [Bacillus cereus]|uniref:hypothetical protein n=1 Tax=Bacillus cereus TaxID=1396 RepID=UPI001C552B53